MDAGGDPRDRSDAEEPVLHTLNRRQRDVAVIGWCSFLVAAVGTMVFFAWVDPLALADVTEPPLPVDRMTGYAVGFFFLWLLCAASAALTVYLIRTRHGHPPPLD
jgi:peptidoglycan/LPS O-acetylase OafA/YrhL